MAARAVAAALARALGRQAAAHSVVAVGASVDAAKRAAALPPALKSPAEGDLASPARSPRRSMRAGSRRLWSLACLLALALYAAAASYHLQSLHVRVDLPRPGTRALKQSGEGEGSLAFSRREALTMTELHDLGLEHKPVRMVDYVNWSLREATRAESGAPGARDDVDQEDADDLEQHMFDSHLRPSDPGAGQDWHDSNHAAARRGHGGNNGGGGGGGGAESALPRLKTLRPAFDIYSRELRNLTRWREVPAAFLLGPEERGRFFLYQPSGGWGNQRLILRWAIIAANAMNRTLVLPPVGPHSSFYTNFNKFTRDQVLHMGQVLDLESLNKTVFAGIKVHDGDMTSYQTGILQHLRWREYEKNPAVSFLTEKSIMARWGKETADVVFWHKASMWKCCATTEINYYTHINYAMVFAKPLQALTMRAAAAFSSQYNAIHFRRGDSLIYERRSVRAYVKYHGIKLHRFNRSLPLYLATDEKDLTFFEPLRSEHGFAELVFARDLDKAEIDALLAHVPPEMQGTVLGFVDQIICDFAERWSGSMRSTFSYYISAMRNRRRRKGRYFARDPVPFLPR